MSLDGTKKGHLPDCPQAVFNDLQPKVPVVMITLGDGCYDIYKYTGKSVGPKRKKPTGWHHFPNLDCF